MEKTKAEIDVLRGADVMQLAQGISDMHTLNRVERAWDMGYNAATLNKYTKEEVIEKLILFGEHVSEKCTGSKLSMIGELNEWCKLNLQ